MKDLMRLSGSCDTIDGSSWVEYRARSAGHKDTEIGGTSRQIRRMTERRRRTERPMSDRHHQRRGFGQ